MDENAAVNATRAADGRGEKLKLVEEERMGSADCDLGSVVVIAIFLQPREGMVHNNMHDAA